MTFTRLIGEYWASLISFGVFGLLHSIGARESFKNTLSRWTRPFFVEHFWRLLYCVLSFAALYYGIAELHWTRHPENEAGLVVYPDWLWRFMNVLHLGSIALMYAALLQSGYMEFLGLKQAWRGILVLAGHAPKPASLDLFGTHRLVTTGVYAWARHTLMASGLLFLLTSGPSLNDLVYTLMYAICMVICGYPKNGGSSEFSVKSTCATGPGWEGFSRACGGHRRGNADVRAGLRVFL